jgi:hypothetical protein
MDINDASRYVDVIGKAFIIKRDNTWFDAWGFGVVKFLEDFVGHGVLSADVSPSWTSTAVGNTTAELTSGMGSQLLITTGAIENDGLSLQLAGESFNVYVGHPCYFGCQFSISSATQSDFLIGLCITDTDLLGGMTDGVYFRKVDGSANMTFVLGKDSVETESATLATITADMPIMVEFYFDGLNIDAYVNGSLATRLAQTTSPNDEDLTPSIEFLTGSAAAITMSVDWIRVIQLN